MTSEAPLRVVMVCMGNICRSPIAEAVFRARADAAGLNVDVSSAGTGGWHAGDNADPRSLAVLAAAGYPLQHSARQFRREWFDSHDLVIAMDARNRDDLRDLRADVTVHLLREWDPQGPGDVPDPYYGNARDFADVLAMVERSCDGLVDWLRATQIAAPTG